MKDSRSDETTDDDCRTEQIDPLIANQRPREPEGELAADEETDEREDRMPGERRAEDRDPRIEGQLDQGAAILRGRVNR